MNSSLSRLFKLLLEAGWRRRWLILIPFVVIVPASMVFAVFGPQTYVAKSLMLLQESVRDMPLVKDQPSSVRMQERIAGLQALLKSDFVLLAAMRDVVGERDPASQSLWVQEFSQAVSVELVGNEFLEFRLKGTQSKGLGKQLESVTTRFLEAMLPEQSAQNAGKVLIEKRKEEIENAERARQSYLKRFATEVAALTDNKTRGQLANDTLLERKSALTVLEAEWKGLQAQVPEATSATRLNAAIERMEKELAAQNGRAPPPTDEIARLNQNLLLLQRVQQINVRRISIEAEILDLQRAIEKLEKERSSLVSVERQLSALEKNIGEAQAAYQAYVKRYSTASSRSGLAVLNAPERIKLIDAARDPDLPINSPRRYVFLGVIAALVLGVGMASLAEALDGTLRWPEQFTESAGLPVVAVLPYSSVDMWPQASDFKTRSDHKSRPMIAVHAANYALKRMS